MFARFSTLFKPSIPKIERRVQAPFVNKFAHRTFSKPGHNEAKISDHPFGYFGYFPSELQALECQEIFSSAGESIGRKGKYMTTHNDWSSRYKYYADQTREGEEILTSSGESLGIKRSNR